MMRDADARETVRLYRETLATCEKVLGPDHPRTLASRNNLASAYQSAGDFASAIALYKETLAARKRVLGARHPDTLTTRTELTRARRSATEFERHPPDVTEAGALAPVSAASARASRTASRSGLASGTSPGREFALPVRDAVRRVAAALAALLARSPGWERPAMDRLVERLHALRRTRPKHLATVLEQPEHARSPLGSVVRFVALTLAVSGLLVISDATVTLVWREPITAVLAQESQGGINNQLDKLLAAGQLRQARATRRLIAADAAALNLRTPNGHPVGRIRIPRIGISFAVVQGDDESALELGPGHYQTTPLPGAAGRWTIGIAGHRTTYLAPFRNIDQLRHGDRIFVTMPYARFTYRVEHTVIVDPTDPKIFANVGYNRLALSACNPPFSAAQRIIVYARQTRMTPLVSLNRNPRVHPAAIRRVW